MGGTCGMEEKKSARRILVGVSGKRPLWRTRCRWKDNVKMDIEWDDLDWILPALQPVANFRFPKKKKDLGISWLAEELSAFVEDFLWIEWVGATPVSHDSFSLEVFREEERITLHFPRSCLFRAVLENMYILVYADALQTVSVVCKVGSHSRWPAASLETGRWIPGTTYVPSTESESTLGRKSLTHTGVMSRLC